MLTPMDKIRAEQKELMALEAVVEELLAAIYVATDSTLKTNFGVYLQQGDFKIPEFHFWNEYRQAIVNCIRQTCTGELSIEKSQELLSNARILIKQGLECFA